MNGKVAQTVSIPLPPNDEKIQSKVSKKTIAELFSRSFKIIGCNWVIRFAYITFSVG